MMGFETKNLNANTNLNYLLFNSKMIEIYCVDGKNNINL
jgi:hypothetical protein